MGAPISAQVELKLQLGADGQTYTAFARSQSDLLPPLDNILHSAQIAVTVPTGSFELQALQGIAGQWALTSFIQHPAENPSVDYALFSLTAPTADLVLPAGQPVPLFSFQNMNGCTGALEIMHPTADPFLPPNSLNLPIRSELRIEGLGTDNAVVGVFDTGSADCFRSANCLITSELELLPNGFYQIAIVTDPAFVAPANLEMLQVAVRVPTNDFQIHGLANLLPGQFSFGNTTRFDGPAEDEDHDYIQFRMNATGLGLSLQAGQKIPLLQFANGGSCQGDSIFLVKNDDPFLPPNSQSASIGQFLRFFGDGAHRPICASAQRAAAACTGCLYTDGLLKLDSAHTANPVICLGGQNGMLRLFAHGAPALSFSIDGGQHWSASPYFDGLGVGTYLPVVRGVKYGCPVSASGAPIELQPGTQIDLQLEVPATACAGSDVPLKILSPSPLPANASFAWSGPLGFQPDFADPVLFGVNSYQSGNYTLLMTAPGCDPASATAPLQVHPLPAAPDILSNGPVCFGEKLKLSTAAQAAVFDWYGPLGAGLPVVSGTDSVAYIDQTMPDYTSGTWLLKATDAHGCSAMSAPLAVHIKPLPQAFAETSGAVCAGGQVQLLSNPLPGASYEWKVLGESALFSAQPNPLISNVLAPKTYQLVVTQDGCVSPVPATVTVALSPSPSIAPAGQYSPAPDCSPKALQLTANAICPCGACPVDDCTGLTYAWSGPNGFASQSANPSLPAATAAANGIYLLQVANIFGCTASQEVAVGGIPNPVPKPLIQGAAPVCPGGGLQLSVAAYTGSQVSYQWFFGASQLAGQNSNSLVFNAIQPSNEGSYKVRVTVDGCTVESASQFVDVLDKPQPNPDFYLSNPCEGGSLAFFTNTTGISSWHWTGPGGFSSDAPNPVIYNTELDDVGTYQLTVTGTNGCTANASLVIDGILPVPDAPLVASNSPVCPGSELILTVQNPTLLGSVGYEWQNGLGQPVGTGEATLSLASDDPMAVPPFLVKTIVNTCPSALSDAVAVQVLPAPQALAWNGGPVCEGGTAQLFAAAQPNASYAWLVGGQVVSIEQNPSLVLSDSTDFQLVVKTNGCSAEAVATTTVPVNPVPVIIGLPANQAICEGSPVSLSAMNSVAMNGAVQYLWAGPNGFSYTNTAAAAGPFPLGFSAIAQQNEGSYTLTLTSAEGCVSSPQSVAVEVKPVPATPTLTLADAQLCEGETLQLDATPVGGASVSYDWFFNGQWLATTASPTYLAPGANLSQSGVYAVNASVGGCQAPPSNQVLLTVIALPVGALATNTSSSLSPACEGTDVALSATLLPGAAYNWYGPLGFFSNLPSPVLDGVQGGQAGDYLVVIGYPQCSTTLAYETTVFVAPTPSTPVLGGAASVCEGGEAVLSVQNAETGAVYDFYFGQNGAPFQTGSSTVVLPAIDPAQAGAYFASASLNGCASAFSAPMNLAVVPAQTGIAFAGDDQTLCAANEIATLRAQLPTTGAGHWSALDGATVVQPNAALTNVLGLVPGSNRFVWTLTNGLCPGAGSDTVAIFLENLKAVDDFYSLPVNDSLLNIKLLENDFIQYTPDFDFTILAKPTKGQLLENELGEVTYTPYPNAFGEDGFRYRICSMTCPDACDEATVRISLDGSVAAPDCFRPNLITPDGDGLDDLFVIPCAAGWPGSSMLVFNRWGAVVYASDNYQNDWGGTYQGQPLPPGTYFYQLRLKDGKGTVLQGYVAVQ